VKKLMLRCSARIWLDLGRADAEGDEQREERVGFGACETAEDAYLLHGPSARGGVPLHEQERRFRL
jgi:hypothetical protein